MTLRRTALAAALLTAVLAPAAPAVAGDGIPANSLGYPHYAPWSSTETTAGTDANRLVVYTGNKPDQVDLLVQETLESPRGDLSGTVQLTVCDVDGRCSTTSPRSFTVRYSAEKREVTPDTWTPSVRTASGKRLASVTATVVLPDLYLTAAGQPAPVVNALA